eukprot:642635-Ditylum_brightwellii.AAC.1
MLVCYVALQEKKGPYCNRFAWNKSRWLVDVLPRQWMQVQFSWKKLLNAWFSNPVFMSGSQPDVKQGNIVIHA